MLDVRSARRQWVAKELLGTYLQHVQDDLGVLGIVLISTFVQRFTRAGQSDRGVQLPLKSGLLIEMMLQRPMTVAGCFEPDPDRRLWLQRAVTSR